MAAKKRKSNRTERDEQTLGRIEKLARRALMDVDKGNNPALEIRTRTLSNVAFNEKTRIIELGEKTQSREFFNVAMARKFMQTFWSRRDARRSSTRARPSAFARCST